jgi:hypothetical protein
MKKTIFLSLALCFAAMAQAVTVSKTVTGATAGNLSSLLTPTELSTVTNLTITGTLDARDFKSLRDNMPLLSVLDISGVSIAKYVGTAGNAGTTSATYKANYLPQYAFSVPEGAGKTSLTSISLPTSIIGISSYAFAGCTGISYMVIPDAVTDISDSPGELGGVFFGCTSLKAIKLSANLKYIGTITFKDCTALTTLNIPASVTDMSNLFSGCTSLTSIQMNSVTPPRVDSNTFDGLDLNLCTLYIPAGSYFNYRVAPWDSFLFGSIIEGQISTGISNSKMLPLKAIVKGKDKQLTISNIGVGVLIKIYNMQGKAIYSKTATTDMLTVSLSTHGVYVINIGNYSTKITL